MAWFSRWGSLCSPSGPSPGRQVGTSQVISKIRFHCLVVGFWSRQLLSVVRQLSSFGFCRRCHCQHWEEDCSRRGGCHYWRLRHIIASSYHCQPQIVSFFIVVTFCQLRSCQFILIWLSRFAKSVAAGLTVCRLRSIGHGSYRRRLYMAVVGLSAVVGLMDGSWL